MESQEWAWDIVRDGLVWVWYGMGLVLEEGAFSKGLECVVLRTCVIIADQSVSASEIVVAVVFCALLSLVYN